MASYGPGVEPILRAERMTKLFGGIRVLDAVDLACYPGQVHALLGANGAGKSTLIQICTGVYQPDGGQVWVEGSPVRLRKPIDAERLGIAAVYQELSLVDDLDVAHNIFLGREARRRWMVDKKAMYERSEALLRGLNIDIDPHTNVSALSLARRQLVELAKALMREAKLLILDEATAALTSAEQERLFAIVGDLRAQGRAILYVTHRLEEVFRIADRVSVLRDGKLVASGSVSSMDRNSIIEAMVGGTLAAGHVRHSCKEAEESNDVPVLVVRDLSGRGFTDISFKVWPREILGLAGSIGSGRSSLLRALFGVGGITSGSVRLNGRKVELRSVRAAVRAGIALVTEDRKRTGLAPGLSIHHNLNSVRLRSRLGVYRRSTALHHARRVTALVSLNRDVRHEVRLLSGGNQQKVAVGKWLAVEPSVLLCDEPTRGIDVGARADLYLLLRTLTDSGVGVVIASSDMEELLSITDRILVLSQGRLVATFQTVSVTEEALTRAVLGAYPNSAAASAKS
jgi:ribose transport system ATP-binding protein